MRQKIFVLSFNSDYRSKCKHLLVEISVQSVQLTDITMLNSNGSHHSRLSCMKGVNCVQKQNYLASDINTCIQFQLNCEYHNSAFSVYSVYRFLAINTFVLILPFK
jgi:hypothetical protein